MNILENYVAGHEQEQAAIIPQRLSFDLSWREVDEFERLRPIQGEAIAFWRRVAESRGLDPKTIISVKVGAFSGLPSGHNKHWCWPSQLHCKHRP